MEIIKKIIHHFTDQLTVTTAIGALLGNVIMAFGVSLLRLSNMGNDPYNAMCMAMSDAIGIGLGTFQVILNIFLIIVEIIWGLKYIGFGSIINMYITGFIIQFFTWVFAVNNIVIADDDIVLCLLAMLLALVLLGLGLSMYQVAAAGVSAYDSLALIISERTHGKYFFIRIAVDSSCVIIILIALLLGFIDFKGAHLGLGTVCVAFILGPFVSIFNPLNEKWIKRKA